MFQRKKVIIQIENNNKIISEFNTNITIFYIKIYIRDRTNIKNFDLYFKGNRIKNNNLPLVKFFHYNDNKPIKFTLKKKIVSETERLKSNNNSNINIFTNRNKIKNNNEQLKLYEKEIFSVKEKNNQLINNINKYKENINECIQKEKNYKEEYISIENLLAKQKEEINILKNEINKANIKYKDLKHQSLEKEKKIKKNQLQYTKSNDNFSIIHNHRRPKRSLSVESFSAYYPIKKELKNHGMKSINLTSENIIKERISNPPNKNSYIDNNININNNQLKILTNNISNIKEKSNYNENKNEFNLNGKDAGNSRNEKIKINNNNNDKESKASYNSNDKKPIKYKYQIKEYNSNTQIIDDENPINENANNKDKDSADNPNVKEEDKVDFNNIINEFNSHKTIKKQLLSREKLLNENSLKLPIIYDSYYSIFNYLNKNEILTFSFINKSNGVCPLFYWINYLENKIIYLNDNYNSLIEKYNLLSEKLNTVESKSNSILSYFSKSGLRVLNSPHYLDIFNNPIEYFTKDNLYLFIYKMLFHFIKLYDENKNISDNDFISFMKNEIKEKTKSKKSLREYICNLLDKEIDLSFENVNKAKNIMKYYNIENIEGNKMAKFDRATTIIGYVIRDIMGFTGLIIKLARKILLLYEGQK